MAKNDLIDRIHGLTPGLFEKKDFVPGETFIPTGWAVYDERELNAIISSVVSGHLGLLNKGREFEENFAEYNGCKKSVLVNSGSSANFLAMEALRERLSLERGDAVITPACGFPTTLNPIIQLGFTPYFVDVDESYNISTRDVENAIDDKVKGIVFAHTLGNPADMGEIMRIAEEHDLFVMEDCCDAYGARYNGKKCGSFGNVSTASFYPAHNITLGGEGGAISTNDLTMNRIIRSLRDWGKDCHCDPGQDNACGNRFNFEVNGIPYDHKYIFSRVGYNLKPTEMQAAMGVEQMQRIDEFNSRRVSNYNSLRKRFSKFEDSFSFPEINEGAEPVFFGFPIMIEDDRIDRRELANYLNHNKIGTRYLFGGNLLHQPAYKSIECKVVGDLKRTNEVERNLIWIGCHQGLGEEEIDYIESKFKDYLE
jgi:CDP-4-dehydro-6-deoxyglucose reductase, E1